MKVLNKLLVLAIAPTLLVGCQKKSSSLKQVTYEEFHTKAVEAKRIRPTCGYTKVVVRGSLDESSNIDYTFDVEDGEVDFDTSESSSYLERLAASIASLKAEDFLLGYESTEWYVGSSGFRIVFHERPIPEGAGNGGPEMKEIAEFNKYGQATSYFYMSGPYVSSDLKIKWS